MSVSLILDTDIGTDVDDALALAFAVRHPEIDLRAVTTVSADAVRRAHIAAKLLALAGRPDVEVAAGVGWGASPGRRRDWGGHEGEGLLDPGERPAISARDAVTLLCAEGRPDVTLATVGMQSNLAAALERDPGLARRLRQLVVMGGVFGATAADGRRFDPAEDHNLNVDPGASVRSLNAGLPTMYVPCDVTFQTYLTQAHLQRLRAGDALCRALAALTERWAVILRGSSKKRRRDDQVAAMHDPLAVACLVERTFVTVDHMPVTVAVHGGSVRTFVDPAAGHPAEVVTSVDAEAFAAYWLDVVAGA